MTDSVVQVQYAGPSGTKKNLVILGDGFAAGADQDVYNDYVDQQVMAGVFNRDLFMEDRAAWNVFRVNLESPNSGISTRTWVPKKNPKEDDPDPWEVSTENLIDTSLDIIFSGQWNRCWLEYGKNSEQAIVDALKAWVPDWNMVLIVLNTPGFGGCGGGGRAHVTLGAGWDTIAHEFGHGLGGLADEYCSARPFEDPDPQRVNVTTQVDRKNVPWNNFIASSTPVPTGKGKCSGYTEGQPPVDWNSSQSVGLFEGGHTYETGIGRPVLNCRMNSNSPPFCPVCYTSFKRQYDQFTGYNFNQCHAGDFSGDGRSDVLVHSGNALQIFGSIVVNLEIAWSAVDRIPGGWQIRFHDRYFVGDFDGDGRDEVLVWNPIDWATPSLGLLVGDGARGLKLVARYDGDIPGWGGFALSDLFLIGDFDGDGRDDVFIVNTPDWSTPYLGMLRSTGTGFELIRRFDGDIPGWGGMAPGDRFYVGDFSGNGRDDLYAFNGTDWDKPYVGMFRSTGTDLKMTSRYDGDIPGWGGLARHDRLIVGDFDGDGKADLYIFNGEDWDKPYLGMFRSTGTALELVNRFDGDVPGWGGMARNDKFRAADITGDGKVDLFAWNMIDWSETYIGRMLSTGAGLSADYVANRVDEWKVSAGDRFEVGNYRGGKGRPTLFAHNANWFGMMNFRPDIGLDAIYYRWIHFYRHGRNW